MANNNEIIHIPSESIYPYLAENNPNKMNAQECQKQFMELENNPKYRCCCGTMLAVQGANIMAIISLVFHLFLTLLVNWLLLPLTIYQILIAIFLLIGHSKRNPDLYLSSLLLQGIYLIPASLALFGALIYWFRFRYIINNEDPAVAILFLLSLPMIAISGIYFYVIWKAYRYMEAEKQWKLENPPTPIMVLESVINTTTTTNNTQPQQYVINPSIANFALIDPHQQPAANATANNTPSIYPTAAINNNANNDDDFVKKV